MSALPGGHANPGNFSLQTYHKFGCDFLRHKHALVLFFLPNKLRNIPRVPLKVTNLTKAMFDNHLALPGAWLGPELCLFHHADIGIV